MIYFAFERKPVDKSCLFYVPHLKSAVLLENTKVLAVRIQTTDSHSASTVIVQNKLHSSLFVVCAFVCLIQFQTQKLFFMHG